MKKTKSLQLKRLPQSQPSISSFFNKQASKETNAMSKDDPAQTSKRKLSTESDKTEESKHLDGKLETVTVKNVADKKFSTKLLKGKYHDSTDHTVPDILQSPVKKVKLDKLLPQSGHTLPKLNLNAGSNKVKKITEVDLKHQNDLSLNVADDKNYNVNDDKTVNVMCNKTANDLKHQNEMSLNVADNKNSNVNDDKTVNVMCNKITNDLKHQNDMSLNVADNKNSNVNDDKTVNVMYSKITNENVLDNKSSKDNLVDVGNNKCLNDVKNNLTNVCNNKSPSDVKEKVLNVIDNKCLNDVEENVSNNKNNDMKTIKNVARNKCSIDTISNLVIDKENCNKHPMDKNKISPLKITNDIDGVFSEDFDEFNQHNDVFDDDFFIDDFSDEKILDLTKWQRCVVLEHTIGECHTKVMLRLRESNGEETAVCYLQGFWMDAKIKKGDTISLIAHKQSNDSTYLINDINGLVVIHPDTLVSGTSVVGSLFCKRKAIFQDKYRGVDGPNKAMVIGSLVHELFQTSVCKRFTSMSSLQEECDSIMKSLSVVYSLHDANLDPAEIKQEVMKYSPQILGFISKYVLNNEVSVAKHEKQDWNGKVEEIVDIEENIWCPSIGIKGKIDVTVNVTIHDRKKKKEKKLVPLELKTGRPTLSAEHRGQVILYNMMLEQTNGTPNTTGLLLYLKDSVAVHEISSGNVEKRDLIMLRNDLAYYLSKWTENDHFGERDNGQELLEKTVELPEPINHHSACGKCPYLTLCSVYLKTSGNQLSNEHPLKKLEEVALSHFTPEHISYFLRWSNLICLEVKDAAVLKPLKDIWTLPPEQRMSRGKCLVGVQIVGGVSREGDRFYHTFQTSSKDAADDATAQNSGLQIGEYVVMSTKDKFAVASGTIVQIQRNTITVLLERDLTKRNDLKTSYNIDTYETSTIITYNLTNLGLLMDNDDVANNLRSIIIDKKPATFDKKISRTVVDKSKDILKRLNVVQQRAILKALATQDYLLIRGMPGTGKTQTIVALIEILYRLGKQVLVTSQTHSAVDNIFLRLKNSNMKLLRLGSSKRIHKDLLEYSEGHLMENNPQDLIELYSKAQIVGVTCLGSSHSLMTKRCFDICIVDESTQVLQPSILRPLFAAKKFVLVGDPDQLPPIVRSNKARVLGLDQSLFSRLDCEESTTSLSLQYRMNKPIMNLANFLTYNGALKAANLDVENATLFSNSKPKNIKEETELWLQCCLSDALNDAVIFLDTGSTNKHQLNANKKLEKNRKDYGNIYEALIVKEILTNLIELGVQSNEIGIIAPYREQVACLREKNKPDDGDMREVEINTVDQFQGRDKRVVLFSCTKSRTDEENLNLKSTENEILEDKRRLTVAITRAKHKLVIVGDANTLNKYKPFEQLILGIGKYGKTFKINHVL